MYRRLFHNTLATTALLAVALVFAACDNAEDDVPDSERIVGTWEVETVNATTGIGLSIPVLDLESGGDESSFDFDDDGTFAFTFDPADGRSLDVTGTPVSIPLDQPVSFDGTFVLDEPNAQIRLTTDASPGGVVFGYRFRGSDDLELIADDPGALALLLGLAAPELEVLATVVTGGSFALRKR